MSKTLAPPHPGEAIEVRFVPCHHSGMVLPGEEGYDHALVQKTVARRDNRKNAIPLLNKHYCSECTSGEISELSVQRGTCEHCGDPLTFDCLCPNGCLGEFG